MRVESIALLRPNALGDFVFALPALRALRSTWPQARITYLGKRWHAGFLPGRGVVDEVLELPATRGVTSSDDDAEAMERFCESMRARRLDLALQLFGGGRHSNAFVKRLGARLTVGLRSPDAPPLDRTLPYLPLQNERLRLLEAAALAGARPAELAPGLAVLGRDREELVQQVALPPGPLAVLQPGATDPRRRWPAASYAAVGDALAQAGAVVAVNGSEDERTLTAEVVRSMAEKALDLGGRLSLSGLTALLGCARVVVSNDTGPLHLAQAVGAATVGVYWLTNLLVSGPLVSARHRRSVSVRVRCPVCGAENLTTRCAHDPSFVDDISAKEVTALALALWRETREAGEIAPALHP